MFCYLTVNSTAFYQLNNHYINFSELNGNATCHIYGDLEERKLSIDIIYRLLHYYQHYFFVRPYVTVNCCLDYKGGLENKINEGIFLKN